MKTEIKDYVKKWMDGHEPGTFVKNEHGAILYSAGYSTLNLQYFFENLLEAYIDDSSPDNTARTADERLRDKFLDDCTFDIGKGERFLCGEYLDPFNLFEWIKMNAFKSPQDSKEVGSKKECYHKFIDAYDASGNLTFEFCPLCNTVKI